MCAPFWVLSFIAVLLAFVSLYQQASTASKQAVKRFLSCALRELDTSFE